MTRFDEPIRGSASTSNSSWRAAARSIASRPWIALTMTLLTTVAILSAVALHGLWVGVPAALNRAFVAGPIVVFAAPSASRAETDALGARLKALPVVADAILRPKEEALVALIQAGLPQPGDARNPLPDAWILSLRAEAASQGSFVTTATGLRDTVAALPGVDQVRFDARWNERLEQWSILWKSEGQPMVGFGLAVVALGTAGLWFVARDAILRSVAPSERSLIVYVVMAVVTAGLLAGLLVWLAIGSSAFHPAAVGGWFEGSVAALPGAMAATTLLAALIAVAASHLHRRDSL